MLDTLYDNRDAVISVRKINFTMINSSFSCEIFRERRKFTPLYIIDLNNAILSKGSSALKLFVINSIQLSKFNLNIVV